MGNSKRVSAREDVNQASTEPDASGPLPTNGDQKTSETMEEKTARVTEDYIRVKAELDNENLKLQHLTQRRTTQQALSDPNTASIDRMFSMDTAGLYVYNGSHTCCLNATWQPCPSGTIQSGVWCKHEVCLRAKSTGISWKELDTIKRYDMRIRHGKTGRMKSALIKQRDVELVRIKQLEDEEHAKFVRRFNKRARDLPIERHTPSAEDALDDEVDPQDLDTVVFESRISMMQIQKYNIFAGVRQQSMADMAKCSDIVSMALLQKVIPGSNSGGLEEHLRQAQIGSEILKNDVEWYEKKLAEAAQIGNAVAVLQRSELEFDLDLEGTGPHSKELCDLVKGLLTDLGMPIETIDNVEHAQSALAHVMRQPAGSKSLKVQKTLDRIKEVVYKFRARSNEIRASDPDAASYHPMPASSGDLRNRIISASVKQGRSAGFENEIYPELIQIEDDAVLQVHAGYQRLLASPVKLALLLENSKTVAMAKSPVPDTTEKMVDIMNSTLYDMSKGHAILEKLDELSDQVLVANISGLVFARAEKKAEWLLRAFAAIEAMFEAISIRPLPIRIAHALERVQTSAQARVKAGMEVAIVPKRPQVTTPAPGNIVASASQTRNSGQSASPVVGTTSTYVAVGKDEHLTAHEQSIVDTVEFYTAETASRYASYLSQRKYCPGCATLRIAQLFAALLKRHPQRAGRIITALSASHPAETGDDAAFHASTETSAPEMWTHTISCGVKCITDMFHALTSDIDAEPAPERKAPLFGEMIALVVEGVVCGGEVEQTLSLGNPSFSILKAASIMKKFSEDGRFACAAFDNGPCSQHTNGQHPDESRRPPPSVSNTVALPISEVSRPKTEEVCSDNIPPPAKENEQSETLTISVVPGPARRRLLPRGERYQSQNDAFEAAAKIAGMGINLARKMSDFFTLQQKAYERAGLALSPEAQYCMKQVRRIAYQEPGTRAQDHHDCQCPPCVANRTKATSKTSKFVENFSDAYNEFEVTIDGRAVAEDELLGYTGATVERIRSISSGEATLEYVCWIAHQVSEAADVVEAAGEERTLPIQRFEEFFTYYAPISLELELALDYAKGDIWPSPVCRDLFPSDQWPIIDDVVAIMGRIHAKQLTFANGTDDWQFTESMVPEPLNLRKDRPDRVGTADSSAEPTSEALTLGVKLFLFAGEPQQSQVETEKERLRLDKTASRTEAIRAQIDAMRRIDETTITSSPPVVELSIQRRFNAYNASARPIMEYMGTLAEDDFIPEKDFILAIAIRVQTQHLDCVRMIQLVAESKGWDATAAQMKEHLDDWGFREDEDGHYPDFWAGEQLGDRREGEHAGDEQGTSPPSASDRDV